jgi:phage repressor protein C with HTH and peptisase S24 domain
MPIPEEEQKQIIPRIRHLLTVLGMPQSQFAARLGINPANMSKHLSGKLPITKGLINRIALDFGVSRTWLTTGQDVPFAKTEADHLQHVSSNNNDKGDSRQTKRDANVPIYDIDVTAGFGPLSRIFTDENVVGTVSLPQMRNPETLRIVRVTGDSMTPTLPNGAYIAIREWQSSTILWGQIYVVVMEDFRMVKVVRRHVNDSKVTLHSLNPDYDDIDVRRADISGLYLVEAILNYTPLY